MKIMYSAKNKLEILEKIRTLLDEWVLHVENSSIFSGDNASMSASLKELSSRWTALS